MSESGLTISQISAAGAYARSERLAAESIPVRAIDPTRRRFQVDDQTAAKQTAAQTRPEPESADADGQSASAFGGGKSGGGWGGGGLLGAVTSFLARMFAQPETGSAVASSSAQAQVQAQAGALAYARTAANVPFGNYNDAEVLSPNFPRLSSGRALDLTV